MKLINVDDLTDDVILKYLGRPYYSCLPDIRDMLDETPTVDAEPVVHAHWCSEDGECSHCGRSLSEIMDSDSFFAVGFNLCDVKCCLWCGAKMDGGRSNVEID